MLNIAFFVEGGTERIFLEGLINEYFSHPYFNIETFELLGDQVILIKKGHYSHEDLELSFIIYDVHNDSRVVSAILERGPGLISKGFQHIIGIRDVFPAKREDSDVVVRTFNELTTQVGIDQECSLFCAIMEIEAWIISDPDLFIRISNSLTPQRINQELHIDIERMEIEEVRHPAELLNRIYQIIGRKYKKKETETHSLCSIIDYMKMWLDDTTHERIPSFKVFIDHLEKITTNP